MKVPSITLVLALGLCGCAGITASKAKGPVPNGVRIYPPKVLFLVDAEYDKGRGRTSIVVVGDAAKIQKSLEKFGAVKVEKAQ